MLYIIKMPKKIKESTWTPQSGQKIVYSTSITTLKCTNDDKIIESLILSHHKYIDTLDDFDKELLNAYCDNSRNFKINGKYVLHRDRLNDIIHNAPPLKLTNSICLWRSHGFMTPHEINSIIKNNMFLSCSLDYETALGFLRSSSCCFYEITISKTPFLIITDYFGRTEEEVILPYETELEVYSKYTILKTTAYLCRD